MANIAVTTANRIEVVESLHQKTLVAAEAILAGSAVRIDTSGKFTNANGTTTTENRIYGIATHTVAAGEALTAVRKGTLAGYTLSSQAYDAAIYLSDTDGRLADSAGTVSTIIGRVVPGTAQLVGSNPDKLLLVDL